MRNKKEKGFTLIELVIVVAILGILMAIAVPAFNGVSKSARAAQAKAYASQLTTYFSGQGVMNMMKSGGVETYPAAGSNGNCTTMQQGALGAGDAGSAASWNTGARTGNNGEGNSACTWTLAADTDFLVKYIVITSGTTDYAIGWSDDAGTTYYVV
ncbi:uncharacterized protein METZ01_LOCUS410399, partial [marine metagenome]